MKPLDLSSFLSFYFSLPLVRLFSQKCTVCCKAEFKYAGRLVLRHHHHHRGHPVVVEVAAAARAWPSMSSLECAMVVHSGPKEFAWAAPRTVAVLKYDTTRKNRLAINCLIQKRLTYDRHTAVQYGCGGAIKMPRLESQIWRRTVIEFWKISCATRV